LKAKNHDSGAIGPRLRRIWTAGNAPLPSGKPGFAPFFLAHLLHLFGAFLGCQGSPEVISKPKRIDADDDHGGAGNWCKLTKMYGNVSAVDGINLKISGWLLLLPARTVRLRQGPQRCE